MGLASVLFAARASADSINLEVVLAAFWSIFLISISAYMLNDVFDLKVDLISNLRRPLPSGVLSVREVLAAGSACLVGGVLLVLLIGSAFSFSIALVLSVLVFAYSAPPMRLRRFYIAPYLTIAGFSSLSFLMASSFLTGLPETEFVLGSLLVFGYSAGSSMVKEFKDIEGDKTDGVRSLPVVLGLERAVDVTIPLYLGACLLILPLYWLFDLSLLFLPIFVAVFLAKAKTSYDLSRDPSNMAHRMGILRVEVISTIILFLGAATSATLGA
jgi:4-hydroxybenzoate polyprenyltransferase